jgi:hypothetical protein
MLLMPPFNTTRPAQSAPRFRAGSKGFDEGEASGPVDPDAAIRQELMGIPQADRLRHIASKSRERQAQFKRILNGADRDKLNAYNAELRRRRLGVGAPAPVIAVDASDL